jgi:Prokaryotic cytochrome b561
LADGGTGRRQSAARVVDGRLADLSAEAAVVHLAQVGGHHDLSPCLDPPRLARRPPSGWLYSSATGVQVVYLGIVPLPNLLPKDKALADLLRGVHIGGNLTLFALVCLHTAAAIRHHWVDRDETLKRMLPFLKTKESR